MVALIRKGTWTEESISGSELAMKHSGRIVGQTQWWEARSRAPKSTVHLGLDIRVVCRPLTNYESRWTGYEEVGNENARILSVDSGVFLFYSFFPIAILLTHGPGITLNFEYKYKQPQEPAQ